MHIEVEIDVDVASLAAIALELELRSQITELQERLAIAQEDLLEMARDAGTAQAELGALRDRVRELKVDRDAWRAQAEQLAGTRTPT